MHYCSTLDAAMLKKKDPQLHALHRCCIKVISNYMERLMWHLKKKGLCPKIVYLTKKTSK